MSQGLVVREYVAREEMTRLWKRGRKRHRSRVWHSMQVPHHAGPRDQSEALGFYPKILGNFSGS